MELKNLTKLLKFKNIMKIVFLGFIAYFSVETGRYIVKRQATVAYENLVTEYSSASKLYKGTDQHISDVGHIVPQEVVGKAARGLNDFELTFTSITKQKRELEKEFKEKHYWGYPQETVGLVERINAFEEELSPLVQPLQDFVDARNTAINNENFVLGYPDDYRNLRKKYKSIAKDLAKKGYTKKIREKPKSFLDNAIKEFKKGKKIKFKKGIKKHDGELTTEDYKAWIETQKKVLDPFKNSERAFQHIEELDVMQRNIDLIMNAKRIEIKEDNWDSSLCYHIIADNKVQGYITCNVTDDFIEYYVHSKDKIKFAKMKMYHASGGLNVDFEDGDGNSLGKIEHRYSGGNHNTKVHNSKKEIVMQTKQFRISHTSVNFSSGKKSIGDISRNKGSMSDHYIFAGKDLKGVDNRYCLGILVMMDWVVDRASD